MKLEDLSLDRFYMYPYSRYGSIGYKVGKISRINTKTVVFDYDTKLSVESLNDVFELSDEEFEHYKSFILFQEQEISHYRSILNRYEKLYEKCKEIKELELKYEEISVNWSDLQKQINDFTAEIGKIMEPMITADNHKFYLNCRNSYCLMWHKEGEVEIDD